MHKPDPVETILARLMPPAMSEAGQREIESMLDTLASGSAASTRANPAGATWIRRMITGGIAAAGVAAAGFLVSANWLIYIWAVTNGRVVETSLGYYINPLFSVMLGVVILKERLSVWQALSFGLAGAAVLFLTVNFGDFPWVAVGLAVTATVIAVVHLPRGERHVHSAEGAVETLEPAPVSVG